MQRSKVRSVYSRGPLEQREVVCVNSVFTCSDRWTNYSECLQRSTGNQVFTLSAAYSHSGGQTHISLLSLLISVSLSVSSSSSLHFNSSLTLSCRDTHLNTRTYVVRECHSKSQFFFGFLQNSLLKKNNNNNFWFLSVKFTGFLLMQAAFNLRIFHVHGKGTSVLSET